MNKPLLCFPLDKKKTINKSILSTENHTKLWQINKHVFILLRNSFFPFWFLFEFPNNSIYRVTTMNQHILKKNKNKMSMQ